MASIPPPMQVPEIRKPPAQKEVFEVVTLSNVRVFGIEEVIVVMIL
jgi:hypothetical protein